MFVATHKKFLSDKPTHELQKLSDTCRACKHGVFNAICYNYDSLLSMLEKISKGLDLLKAVESQGLLLQVKSFKFLVSLISGF